MRPFGPIDDLPAIGNPGPRAAYRKMLDSKERWSVDDTMRMQTDSVAVAAPEIVGAVSDVLKNQKEKLSALENELLDRLQKWDGAHTTDAIEPTVYTYLCDAILEQTVGDELGPNNFAVYSTLGDAWCFLRYVVHREDSPFWDNRTTADRAETRADIFVAAMHETVHRIEETHGKDQSNWTWGKNHTITYTHPLGFIPVIGAMFNIGPLEAPGGAQTINNLLYPHGTFDHKIVAGPSTRRVIDFADPEHSHTILPTGNSGHWLNPHYRDQAGMFIGGEYREAALAKDQIAANKEHELKLLPR